jgi:cytochrome c oxidase subunit 2
VRAPPSGQGRPLALIAFFAVFAVATAAAFGLVEWRPPLASRHGADVDATIDYLFAAAGVIFLAGHAVLAAFLWRYARADGPAAPAVSRRTEWLVGLVPVVLMVAIAEVGVLFIGFPVWAQLYGAPPADALEVEVVGKQFEWLVRYPGRDGAFGAVDHAKIREPANPLGLTRADPAAHDDIVVRGTLRLPAGRHVVVRLRSLDVLHSFWIPSFRTKQDCVPGYTARTQFVATTPGAYELGCAELCGLGHYNMKGTVEVLEPAAFAAWLAAEKGWRE